MSSDLATDVPLAQLTGAGFLWGSPSLVFIAWTSLCSADFALDSLTALPPDHGLQLATHLGLSCTQWRALPMHRVGQYCERVLRAHGHEGVVLYYVDASDRVVGLVKKKTAWYVLCRALREKSKMALAAVAKKNTPECGTFVCKVIKDAYCGFFISLTTHVHGSDHGSTSRLVCLWTS